MFRDILDSKHINQIYYESLSMETASENFAWKWHKYLWYNRRKVKLSWCKLKKLKTTQLYVHELTRKKTRKYIGNNIIKFGSFKTFTNKVQKLFRLSVEESLKQNENKPQLTNRKQVSFS